LSGKLDIQAAAQWKDFGANGFYSLAFPNQFESSKIFMAALNWSLTKDHFTFNSQAYWREHHDRFELFRDMTGAPNWYTGHNYHLTDVTGAKASVLYNENFGKSTVGFEVRNEHIFSNVLGNPMLKTIPVPFETGQFFNREANRLLETGFFDQTVNLDKWYFSAGIAASNSTSFGLYSYGGIDAGYALNENIRVITDANSAVRLPTFTDLYYKSATQLANPDLKPEHSQTFEIGLKMAYPAWKFNADIFKRFGQQVIDWVKEPDSTKWQSKNLTSVNAIGTDLSFEYWFKKSIINKISANYAFLNLDKTAQGFDSKYALDYLKHKISITVEHKIAAHFSAAWSGIYADRAGQYADFLTNRPVNYQPYFIFNGRIKWEQKQMEVFIDLNNILNEKYADFGGLIQPGTEFNITLRLKIGKQERN
jgi:iron complex outermembrane receptor protein